MKEPHSSAARTRPPAAGPERRRAAAPVTSIQDAAGLLPFRRVVLCVLLPFAFGHYLSSLSRTIGVLVSDCLFVERHLSPASLELVNSAHFLTLAIASSCS